MVPACDHVPGDCRGVDRDPCFADSATPQQTHPPPAHLFIVPSVPQLSLVCFAAGADSLSAARSSTETRCVEANCACGTLEKQISASHTAIRSHGTSKEILWTARGEGILIERYRAHCWGLCLRSTASRTRESVGASAQQPGICKDRSTAPIIRRLRTSMPMSRGACAVFSERLHGWLVLNRLSGVYADNNRMSCFWRNSQVAVEPMTDPMAMKGKKSSDMKNKVMFEETAHKEEAHKTDAAHKTHKSTGGSQAHAFVRHLIHNAESRCVCSCFSFVFVNERPWPSCTVRSTCGLVQSSHVAYCNTSSICGTSKSTQSGF